MMPNRQRITIVGTGCIGSSIGLALRASPDAEHLEIVGHDRELGRARQAQKRGAFDRVEFNLHLAIQEAQLIVIAVPLSALREVLQDVGRLLEPEAGVVVTDTAHLKAPVIEWAETLLPSGNYFVGGDPCLAPGAGGWEHLQGLADAHADLFKEALYAITPRAADHPGAIRTVTQLALVLGAKPYFIDPVEHDAARTLSQGVPSLIAAALFEAIATLPGWAEVRKSAGRAFATATAGVGEQEQATAQRMSLLLGRETVLRGLDAFSARLAELREAVAAGDAEALETTLASVAQARAYWMAESRERIWDIEQGALVQDSLFQRTLQALLGEGLAGKP